MRIPNPWPNYPMCRAKCITEDGTQVCLQSTRGNLEIPDGTTEALLEPVKQVGRGGNVVIVAQGQVWSKQWGLMSPEDHLKKVQLVEEEARLAAEREKDTERKQKEARERADAKKLKEAAAPKVDAVVEAKPEATKPKLDVKRSDSGGTKVTKKD